MVWKVTPLFAAWIANPGNILRDTGILGTDATAVELGTGISGLVALTLAQTLSRYIATDQNYALKLLRQNVAENAAVVERSLRRTAGKKGSRAKDTTVPRPDRIDFVQLDWHTDSVLSLRPCLDDGSAEGAKVDVVIACDCIYNEALVDAFVSTCAEICTYYQPSDEKPTLCVIAQQLRTPDVFEAWLNEFSRKFRVWRMPDKLLTPELREGHGFAVHVGVLR